MTLEQLKQQLDEGSITQEQFDTIVKALNLADPEPTPDPNNNPTPDPEPEDIEKIISRAVDRATNKLGNENKKLREQMEKLKRKKLTDDELIEMERKEQEDALAERESAVKKAENRLFALSQIKKIGLDSGDETAISVVDLVLGEDEDEICANVATLKKLVDALVANEVDKAFKSSARVPQKGKSGGGQNNPFAKETYNLTEQMRIMQENPELAAQLKSEAGV